MRISGHTRSERVPPSPPSHLTLNFLLIVNESSSTQEDRYAQIERDNRLLLEKMSHIMRKGGVDNYNSSSKYAKSLNKGARKKELHKITRENQVGGPGTLGAAV